MSIVSVAFCFNDRFCHLAAGAIASLINHVKDRDQYNIYIVNFDISDQNKVLISGINNKPNVFIKFIHWDVQATQLQKLYLRAWYSRDIYTRLFLHKILPSINRLLYIDADTIITCDIATIFKTDLNGYSLAAVASQPHFVTEESKIDAWKSDASISKAKGFEMYNNKYDYLSRHLGLSPTEIPRYFASFILLMDLKRAGDVIDAGVYTLLKDHQFALPDQDILNILFKNKTLLLPESYGISQNNVYIYEKKNGKLPEIIHYDGGINRKPDKNMARYGDLFYWNSISKTEFFYPILEKYINYKLEMLRRGNNKNHIKDELALRVLDHNDSIIIKKRQIRQRYIRLIIKIVVNRRKYKKLKINPAKFFLDSKNKVIRTLGRYYF